MDTIDDGGAAFPCYEYGSLGISMRDYFAAKAMQANLSVIREFPDETWRYGLALDSYMMADAMLKARNEPR